VIQSLRRRLVASDPTQREQALQVLALACPGAGELVPELEPLLAGRSPSVAEVGRDGEAPTLARLLGEANPWLRAGAAWVAVEHPHASLGTLLAPARDDEHPLVRETAVLVAADGRIEPASLSAIETMHFLHVAPFFADLDPSDLYDLSQYAIEETIRPPALLCAAGDADSDALFVVVSGRAAVVGRGGPGEDERTIARLGRGDLIGELSVLDGSPRSTTVRPEAGALRVLRIPGPSLRATLLHRPRAAQSLLRILAGRIRGLVEPGAAPR
jgi:CRP-like cAMP-binding protein